MTIQTLAGASGPHFPNHVGLCNSIPTVNDQVIDAAGEAIIMVGSVILPAGSGSKTISSAGGKIAFITGATTFANGTTNVRVGIQPVSTSAGPPARGTGSYDVRGDLTGGGGGLPATANINVSMGTGTKTITHGDVVAIYVEMTARGGVDSVAVRLMDGGGTGFIPQSVALQASTYNRLANAVPVVYLTFDDGTYGFIDAGWSATTIALVTATAFNSGSTPDEYANIFTLPFPALVTGISAMVSVSSASADFELILYSDPLGTPAAMATVAFDANTAGIASTNRYWFPTLPTAQNLSANTNYAVAVRPTTANNVTIQSVGVSAALLWEGMPMGNNCYQATRSNQSGAFSAANQLTRMLAAVRVGGFDDGASGGGGYSNPMTFAGL